MPGVRVSPTAGTEEPCALIASTPPTVMPPGNGMLMKPRPAFSRVCMRLSIVTPVWTVTVLGEPVFTVVAVRLLVVSTRIPLSTFAPLGTISGDQLCPIPLARTLYPLARAQLAMVTTWDGAVGAQVQAASMSISPDQFL